MSVLTVNLKHLCQRRGVWLPCLLGTALAYALPAMAGTKGTLAVPFLIGLAGVAVGSFQRQVLYRPFVFLLPGHRLVIPRQAVAIGVFVASLTALGSAVSSDASLGLSLAYWSLGLPAYLFGTLVGLWLPFFGCLFGLAVAPVFGAILLGWFKPLEGLPDLALAAASVLALSVIPWLWRALASRDHARFCCGLREVDPYDLAAEARAVYGRPSRGEAPELGSPAAIRHLLGVIRRSRPDSLWRCCHTAVYEWAGALSLRQAASRSLYLAGVILALGYYPWSSNELAAPLFLAPAILVLSCNYVHLRTWLPLGRRGRLKMAMAELVVALLSGSFLALVPILASHALAPVLPTLNVRGHPLVFHAFPYWCALLTFVATPLVVALRTWLGKARVGLVTAMTLTLLAAVAVWVEFSYPVAAMVWLLALGVSLLVSWLVICHHCLHRDLV